MVALYRAEEAPRRGARDARPIVPEGRRLREQERLDMEPLRGWARHEPHRLPPKRGAEFE